MTRISIRTLFSTILRGDTVPNVIQKFDGRLALNSWVIQGGEIRVGDDAEVLMSDNLMSKQTTLNEFGN